MDNVINTFLPALNQKVVDFATAIATTMIEKEVHSRKWSLVVQGIRGESGEPSELTRKKCIDLASQHLGVNCGVTDFAACHRLNNKEKAAIIIRFVDLDVRNRWLLAAKKLATHPDRVSISPDLPPIGRQLKKELLIKRSELDANTKKQSHVKHLKCFPYVQLEIKGAAPIRPTCSPQNLATKYLNVTPYIDLKLMD